MSEPEQIWAYRDWPQMMAFDYETTIGDAVKYTRTDLIPAMIQAAVDAEREAILVRLQRMYEHALDLSDADPASDWKSRSAAAYGVCLAYIRVRKLGAE